MLVILLALSRTFEVTATVLTPVHTLRGVRHSLSQGRAQNALGHDGSRSPDATDMSTTLLIGAARS